MGDKYYDDEHFGDEEGYDNNEEYNNDMPMDDGDLGFMVDEIIERLNTLKQALKQQPKTQPNMYQQQNKVHKQGQPLGQNMPMQQNPQVGKNMAMQQNSQFGQNMAMQQNNLAKLPNEFAPKAQPKKKGFLGLWGGAEKPQRKPRASSKAKADDSPRASKGATKERKPRQKKAVV